MFLVNGQPVGGGGGNGGNGAGGYEIDIAVTTPVADSRRVVVTVTQGDAPAAYRAIRVDVMTNLADLSGLNLSDLTFVWFTRETTRLGTSNRGLELVGQTNGDGEFAFTMEATGIALAGHVAAIVGDSSGSVVGA